MVSQLTKARWYKNNENESSIQEYLTHTPSNQILQVKAIKDENVSWFIAIENSSNKNSKIRFFEQNNNNYFKSFIGNNFFNSIDDMGDGFNILTSEYDNDNEKAYITLWDRTSPNNWSIAVKRTEFNY